MASNSRGSKPSKSSVDQLVAVTGMPREQAKHLLTLCHGDVQLAINFHLEDSEGASSSQVRDPIPPQQEVLVDNQEYGNYGRRVKRSLHSVFDSFRDFQVESRRQEELLSGSSVNVKRRNLEDLFRPPLDLVCQGTFHDARDVGIARKKWLMVNVQNVLEFACQILNRDIWSDKAIRTIVKEEFIFWQVYFDSSEGQRYSAFYNVTEWPYVAIIDPRTGECMRVWNHIESATFCDDLLEFLYQHHFEEQPSPKKIKTGETGDEEPTSAISNETHEPIVEESPVLVSVSAGEGTSASEPINVLDDEPPQSEETTKKSIIDADEEEQLAAAIKASLTETLTNGSSVDSSLRKSGEIETIRMHWGNGSGVETSFMLRYPDGTREIIIVPSKAPVKILTSYVATKGYSPNQYMLVVNFPRRVLSSMEQTVTIEELKLHRQETVFVELR
ncbi:hypothetical protein C0J52_02105 [Blattella germanica]|nr:hypothetical protein C0J52_02105 [Blattella germanica]